MKVFGITSITFISLIFGYTDQTTKIVPDDVIFVTSIDGGAFSYSETVYINTTDTLDIRPVFILDGKYLSSVPAFYLDGEKVDTVPVGNLDYYAYIVSPVLRSDGYDNFENAPKNKIMSHLEPISYQTQNLIILNDSLHFSDFMRQNPSGTYYLQASLQKVQDEFSSTARIHGKDGIIQIVCRNGDDYFGYLTELMGTPFIMFPKVMEDGAHQTDALIGSDCAEFSIYGRRRMGFEISYCGPKKLYEYLVPITVGRFFPKLTDGKTILCDLSGSGLTVGSDGLTPGDILHYGSQVAVFYEDRGTIGILDGEDIVFQSYGETPHYTTLYENAQVFGAFEVYRWK